jgi:hypothetical protein
MSTWATKVNGNISYAEDINLLQTEKVDRDGAIPFTGDILMQGGMSPYGITVRFSAYSGTGSNGKNIFIGGGGQVSHGGVGGQHEGSQNTALGLDALDKLTHGYSCAAFGYKALEENTEGYENAGIGTCALWKNTTGCLNTAIGVGALYYNTTGSYNTACGAGASFYLTTGSLNTSVGKMALDSDTTGYGNTAVGMEALYDLNITANDGTGRNTAIGYNTGRGIVTGVDNTILGANVTGLDAALSNNIIIANGTGGVQAQHDGTNWTLTGAVKCSDASDFRGKVALAINDDSVYSFTPSSPTAGILCLAAPYTGFAGIVAYRTGDYMMSLAKGADLEVTTGALTGTTGTDGKITVSTHTDGKIYIENRRGALSYLSFMIIAGFGS